METIEPRSPAPTDDEPELNLLLVRDTSGDWPRWKRAAVGSVVFHVVIVTLLYVVPNGSYTPPPPENTRVPYVTKLYVPKDLTQKAPNKAPVSKMLLSQPATPAPKIAPPAPELTKAAAPKPPAPVPVPIPAPPAITPAPTPQPPAPTPPPVVVPKPEAPKMIVEDSLQAHPPAPKPGGITLPSTNPIQDAMRSLGNTGTGSSSTRLGDSAEMSVGAGLQLPASAARLSNFELKSDPMGVDFQPYLRQVLTAVKLNWSAVYPQSARLGLRGTVTVEFSILRSGKVQKIVFDGQSGSRALDNAAVAAISGSDPLPTLPAEFKGDRIVLEMTFMYNMPK